MDKQLFELLRPGVVGRKAAIRASVAAAALIVPASGFAAVTPHPINQTGKRPNPINQTGKRPNPINQTGRINLHMCPINQTFTHLT